MSLQNLKRSSVLLTLCAGALAVTGTVAVALIASAGGSEIRIDTRSETVASASNSLIFVDVPGAVIPVSIPAGANRHLTARFAGESQCFGPPAAPAAWCSVQIIARNAAGGTIFFNPNSGVDYAFDSNPAGGIDDQWEGNAVERSLRLPAGNYRISVQRRVTNNTTNFRLDDWHFALETNI